MFWDHRQTRITGASGRHTMGMEQKQRSLKKELHIRLEPELYEKIRHISFYERQSMTELVNRLLSEYVEERAIEEPDLMVPLVL